MYIYIVYIILLYITCILFYDKLINPPLFDEFMILFNLLIKTSRKT